ncbi:MAG: hypothetical protein LC795_02230 [Acidobacteria bacterium]|nr:hypothetical protein [Acidobacteriota bacterium]
MDAGTTLPFKALPPPRTRPALGLLLIALGYGHLLLAIVLFFFLFGSFISSLVSSLFNSSRVEPPNLLLFPLWMLCVLSAVLLHPFLLRLVKRGKALRQADALSLLARDRRAPVLYLRPFDDDDLPDLTLPNNGLLPHPTFEARLHEALAPLGPMVSVGRPGEKVPELGSARLYVADGEWRAAVEFLMGRAAAVVVVFGRSQGVLWEALNALKRMPPERLLFCFPYVLEKGKRSLWLEYRRGIEGYRYNREALRRADFERQLRYQAFREGAGAALAARLPPRLGDVCFLCFREDGEPYFLESSRPLMARLGASLSGSESLPVYLNFRKTLKPFVNGRESRTPARAGA